MLNGPSAYIVIGQPVILAFLSHQLDEHLDRVLLTAVVEKQGLCPMTVAKLRDREIAVLHSYERARPLEKNEEKTEHQSEKNFQLGDCIHGGGLF